MNQFGKKAELANLLQYLVTMIPFYQRKDYGISFYPFKMGFWFSIRTPRNEGVGQPVLSHLFTMEADVCVYGESRL